MFFHGVVHDLGEILICPVATGKPYEGESWWQ
jgi:hypothetical protein